MSSMHDFALTVKFTATVGKHMRPTEDKTSLYRTSYDPFFASTGIDMRRPLIISDNLPSNMEMDRCM